ncbi:inorganic phosphate transporter [Parasphingopyxis algicola]|uniref:inorganic phosphate transporter n=1 Tax=Parasphingopyxis algicola TaxID=2026624 RepID=UPI00159F9705|nr:inorganic phosphate transporter [Parasphingopyxis algicola]QLC26626.1 inorganic phosphate transporter [Parasphingopyxis algicola]
MLIVLLASTALFLAFSNGANDNFKGFATVWGSASLSYRKALILATGATILGGLASVLIADTLVQQFSGKGLVPDALASTPAFALAVGGGAAFTVMLATRLGFPVSTTHALVGGLIGAGLANSAGAIDFGNLGSKFVFPLLVSPFLSAFMAFAAYLILKHVRPRPSESECICLMDGRPLNAGDVGSVARVDMACRAPHLVMASDEACDQAGRPIARASVGRLLDGLHLFSASTICFARGVNDAPKLAALLIAANLFSGTAAAVAGTAAMALGGWLLSRRVAETMSLKINHLDTTQGISANLITATLVLFASRIGVPVSTTHVSVGSIIGTGAAGGTLDLSVVRNVLLSWVATLPIAAGIAFGLGLLA